MSGLSPNSPTLVPQASTQLQGDRAVTKITTCMLAGPNIPNVQCTAVQSAGTVSQSNSHSHVPPALWVNSDTAFIADRQ